MLFCCSLSRSSVVQPKDTATSVEKIHVSGFKALYRRICTRHTHYPSIHDDVCATELATSCVWADGGMKQTLPAWRRLVQISNPFFRQSSHQDWNNIRYNISTLHWNSFITDKEKRYLLLGTYYIEPQWIDESILSMPKNYTRKKSNAILKVGPSWEYMNRRNDTYFQSNGIIGTRRKKRECNPLMHVARFQIMCVDRCVSGIFGLWH